MIELVSPSSSVLQTDSLSTETPGKSPRYAAKDTCIIYKTERDSQTSQKKLTVCCCCLVAKLCPTLLDTMDCSTPGFPVPHHLLQFAQVHVHSISDAVRPSPPLLPPSLPAFNLSQHQGLFQLVSSLHWVVKVLGLQHQGSFPLILTGLTFLMLEVEID